MPQNFRPSLSPFVIKFFVLFILSGRLRQGLLYFFFLNPNIFCGYSKEPSHLDGLFVHQKHTFKLMGTKMIILLSKMSGTDWTPGSDITPRNRIDKPLVV